MTEMFQKYKIIISAIVIFILILILGIWYFFSIEEEYTFLEDDFTQGNVNEKKEEEIQLEEVVQEIVIHISGEVIHEGVINLKEGARIIDAIEKAGGITEKADLSKVNLAYILSDAQKVYIPNINDKEEEYITVENGENVIISGNNVNNKSLAEGKKMVNINTASQEELQSLDGIGAAIAGRIIQYRQENGKFNSIEDIKNVSGIGDAKYEKIKNNISVK